MIRVADYLVKRLEEFGVRHIFMISGGGAMHLVDAVGRSKKIKYVCNHHEQACAMAAEGYSRINNELGVAVVTSGPGGTNTMTGVIGQWLDSVPVLYLSGQVKFSTTILSCPELELRQLGDQEINIVDIVKPVTKYAKVLTDAKDVRKEIEKALYIAKSGRPGPVWLDIPLNVQGAMVDENELEPYTPVKDNLDRSKLEDSVAEAIEMLNQAERPVIIAGHGISVSGARKEFDALVEKLKIPVVTTFNGFDLIPSDSDLFIGRIGTIGDRAGNFALQNADIVLSIGSRNNIRQVSYNWDNYTRAAKKISVDIDGAELKKSTFVPDLPIEADARVFLAITLEQLKRKVTRGGREEWVKWCLERKKRYPTVLKEYDNVKSGVHPYPFIKCLSDKMKEGVTLVAGNGTACVAMFQAGIVKKNQRLFWNSGCASMGYDLPAAIGASYATGDDVVCLAGDGSLMMNLQELQTMAYNKLPIKLFVLNNFGYQSIRQTQASFFNGHIVACGEDSGVGFPDFCKVAEAHGLETVKIDSSSNMDEKIFQVLNTKGPVVCEVELDREYIFSPKLSSEKKPDGRMISKSLEDMFPFLDREEFKSNMIIPPLKE